GNRRGPSGGSGASHLRYSGRRDSGTIDGARSTEHNGIDGADGTRLERLSARGGRAQYVPGGARQLERRRLRIFRSLIPRRRPRGHRP
ncbi:MAG: hypothetical protein ACRDG3_13545, partial [Tepidiformaceae bacterium]